MSGLDVFEFMMANIPFSGTAGKIPRIMVGDIARKHVPVGILGMRILGTRDGPITARRLAQRMDGWWIWATGVGKTVARKDLTEAIGWTTHSISHYPFFIISVRLWVWLLAIAQQNLHRFPATR